MLRVLLLLLCLVTPSFAQRRVPPELCGSWQYLSGGGTYTGGGYMVDRSVTLNADGTYYYRGESSNSGGNGSTAGMTEDQGQWWIEGEILCAQSAVTGELVRYPLELRNHPKTGDPMIVIDGDCYVTASPRAPWPW